MRSLSFSLRARPGIWLACAAGIVLTAAGVPRDTLPVDFGADVPFGLLAPGDGDPHAEDAPLAVSLGRALFFDPVLSADRSVACASCHDPDHGFADPRPRSPGVGGRLGARQAPTLFNRGFGRAFSWTGAETSLADQVLAPIGNPSEMDLSVAAAVERLSADPTYAPLFKAAFADGATRTNLGLALSAFVARIRIGDSPVDRFQAGEFDALDADERAGLWLFESKAGCWRCHAGRNYSDEDFHATGVGLIDGVADSARADVTGRAQDRGRFKTPTLRGLTATAPYMHDGSFATLEDVVAFYRRGAGAIPERDERLQPLDITDDDAAHLVAFLRALSRPSKH